MNVTANELIASICRQPKIFKFSIEERLRSNIFNVEMLCDADRIRRFEVNGMGALGHTK